MTDIPADIMKLAREAIMAEVKPDVRWQYADGRCDHFAVVQAVAKAIMAERERCARVAERSIVGGQYHAMAEWVDGDDIASVIRSGNTDTLGKE